MADPKAIYNWMRLDDRLTTSGQPTEPELAALAGVGVRHVINLALHTHEKALADERGGLAALGIGYTHIPVAFDNPTEADFAAFCAAMAMSGNVSLHVHCIANYRVSAFICRWRRDVLGVDPADARATMERIWQPDAVWGGVP